MIRAQFPGRSAGASLKRRIDIGQPVWRTGRLRQFPGRSAGASLKDEHRQREPGAPRPAASHHSVKVFQLRASADLVFCEERRQFPGRSAGASLSDSAASKISRSISKCMGIDADSKS